MRVYYQYRYDDRAHEFPNEVKQTKAIEMHIILYTHIEYHVKLANMVGVSSSSSSTPSNFFVFCFFLLHVKFISMKNKRNQKRSMFVHAELQSARDSI